jgi:legumain
MKSAVAIALGALASVNAEHYAVLVAGSNTYGNYRHQSDVCHAYQIISKSIPADNIIVMAYDDIANSPSNPYPGQVFNKPTAAGVPGVDVYAGCKIDYKGSAVTPDNFKAVLTGDSSATGKVLTSGPNDKVFINFVDHGAPQLIAFPGGKTLHSTELIGALSTAYANKLYGELVFYLEACESGSMFATLPASLPVFATAASNAHESSWGTYCMPDDKVNGKEIRSCLGDLYSVNWMEDSDKGLATETLEAQYQEVKTVTTKSHVTQFGNMTIADEIVWDFLGNQGTRSKRELRATTVEEAAAAEKATAPVSSHERKANSAINNRDAELWSALSRFAADEREEDALELMQGIQERLDGNRRFHKISMAVTGQLANPKAPQEVDVECHYAVYKHYLDACGSFTSGSMKHSGTLANLCAHTGGDTAPIKAAISNACPK